MEAEMTYAKYDIDELYKIYLSIMHQAKYIEKYDAMKIESLQKRFDIWSKCHKSWVVRERGNKPILYFRSYIKGCCWCKSEFKQRVIRILKALKN
jgi:hypothetical protein